MLSIVPMELSPHITIASLLKLNISTCTVFIMIFTALRGPFVELILLSCFIDFMSSSYLFDIFIKSTIKDWTTKFRFGKEL